jgi:hypothetical protein
VTHLQNYWISFWPQFKKKLIDFYHQVHVGEFS